jgi:hypothetical protein
MLMDDEDLLPRHDTQQTQHDNHNNNRSDEGVRLPLLRVLRTQWPHLPLFCVRVALFSMLQMFLSEMRNHQIGNSSSSGSSGSGLLSIQPMLLMQVSLDDSLAVTNACWLLVGCTWAALGVLHSFWIWCRTPLRHSRNVMGRVAWQYMCAHPLLEDLDLHEAPLWMLWLHMHASGLAVFVLSYCLSGLCWLPQQMLLLTSTVSFMRAHPPVLLRRSRWIGAVGVLCASLLVSAGEVYHNYYAHTDDTTTTTTTATDEVPLPMTNEGHVWLWGMLVPVGLVWLFFGSSSSRRRDAYYTDARPLPHMSAPIDANPNQQHGNHPNNNNTAMTHTILDHNHNNTKSPLRHSDALLSFSLPSLMLIGLVYFTSTPPCPAPLMMVLHPHANQTVRLPLSSDLDAMLQASDPMVMEALNATRQYYEAIAPTWWWEVFPDSIGGVLATFIAPTLLWLCVLIVIRALARSNLGSTLCAYALSTALRKAASSTPHGVAVALLCVAAPLVLLPELRALEEMRLRAALPVLFVETNVRLPVDVYDYGTPPPPPEEDDDDVDSGAEATLRVHSREARATLDVSAR